jgi:predicted transcriptional regulator
VDALGASNSSPLLRDKERRSRIEIICNIINFAQDGESEYKIRKKVCLNGQQVKSYLEELTNLGLIEMKSLNGRKIYVASQTGSQFLKQYDILKKFFWKSFQI